MRKHWRRSALVFWLEPCTAPPCTRVKVQTWHNDQISTWSKVRFEIRVQNYCWPQDSTLNSIQGSRFDFTFKLNLAHYRLVAGVHGIVYLYFVVNWLLELEHLDEPHLCVWEPLGWWGCGASATKSTQDTTWYTLYCICYKCNDNFGAKVEGSTVPFMCNHSYGPLVHKEVDKFRRRNVYVTVCLMSLKESKWEWPNTREPLCVLFYLVRTYHVKVHNKSNVIDSFIAALMNCRCPRQLLSFQCYAIVVSYTYSGRHVVSHNLSNLVSEVEHSGLLQCASSFPI